MEVLSRLARELEAGEAEAVRDATGEALAAGLAPQEILQQGLLAGMAVVGERFRRRDVFLPDVLLAARAMNAGLAVLQPLLEGAGVARAERVVLGTVAGDLHDIGKNLVGILLRGAGFEVVDLGTDVPAARFVDAAVESGARVIGMSALLTTTRPAMRDVVELVRARGLAGQVRTIVGGAPIDAGFAREIGADAYAFDAASAVAEVQALLGGG